MNYSIGADPELFARERGGDIVCAHGLIKGDKANPYPVRNGAVQVDGFALEFNITPAKGSKEFIHNLQDVMAQLEAMVPDHEVLAVPVAHFTPEYMAVQPPEALELGCDPDYNAWSGLENVKPECNLPFRTGAGHIHVGWRENSPINYPHVVTCMQVCRQLDFFLGLPSLLFDDDVKRRSMYGKAGSFRPKEYGVEYRVLSNKWLADQTLMKWVFDSTILGLEELRCGNELSLKYGDIQNIINTSNVDAAKAIMKEEGIHAPSNL